MADDIATTITTSLTSDGALCRITGTADSGESSSITMQSPDILRLIAQLSQRAQQATELLGHPDNLAYFPTTKIDVQADVGNNAIALTLTIEGGARLTFLLPTTSMREFLPDLSAVVEGRSGEANPSGTMH